MYTHHNICTYIKYFVFFCERNYLGFCYENFSNLHFERFLAKASASTCFDGNDEHGRLADNECYFMLLYGVQALGFHFIYSETDDNDEDERLADNECYANGNPPGRLLPSKHSDEITIP